ncbi:MAG: thioredoxin domain-containing protein [Chlamydiia bacterium]
MSSKKNILSEQPSSYLRAHNDDLVGWNIWSEESFLMAKELDKPIFLSIGYSSCHWCKVLQEESFNEETIASMINESFIPILVDREEMPHIDRLYMDFAQLLTQHPAGWPLNLILTPAKIPFYVFTYLPPMSMDGIIGLNDILIELTHLWNSEDKESIIHQTEHLVQIYQDASIDHPHPIPSKEGQLHILNTLYKSFDREHGGFEGEVKFPLSFQTAHLIHLSEVFEDQRPLYFAETTLEKQLFSPLYDPILGGFRRYTSDSERLEPHFEKMLADNAFLLEAYAHMYQVSGKNVFKQTAYELIHFLDTFLKSDWAYGSSQSADHDGEEGGYTLFRYAELQEALSPEELSFAIRYLGASQSGIFEGDNILYLIEEVPESKNGIFESLRAKLIKLILERAEIEVDQKILLSANAQLAHAIIKAGYYLNDRSWIQKGVLLVRNLVTHFYREGKLLHSMYLSESNENAILDDYAYMIRALLTAFETGEYPEGYVLVQELIRQTEELFGSPEGGYYSASLLNTCLVRIKPFLDGTEPSANAIMAESYLRLYGMNHKYDLLRQVESILKLGVEKMTHHPAAALSIFMNQLHYLSKDKKTIFLKKNLEDNANYGFSHPFTSVVVCDPFLTTLIPAIEGKSCINNKTTVYVCTPTSCSEPIDDLEKLGVPWNRVF